MAISATVDVRKTIADLNKFGLNVGNLLPEFIARLSFKGEGYMKGEMPVRTGTLRRSTHAAPTTKPNTIAAGVNYAFIANVRSRRPGYIEKTVGYIEKIMPKESDTFIEQALKKV